MKRKTEDHGTTLTTWEMLTPNLKFKFTTYKEPGQIITTASCRQVDGGGTERYSYGSEYMVEVDRTYHKRVTAPMVQSHHRSDVANLYDKFKAIAITWNVARSKMPRPLTEEEQAAEQAAWEAIPTIGTPQYMSGTLSTASGMRVTESNRNLGTRYDGLPIVHQTSANESATSDVYEDLVAYYRTPPYRLI